jgi:hypothetical protein
VPSDADPKSYLQQHRLNDNSSVAKDISARARWLFLVEAASSNGMVAAFWLVDLSSGNKTSFAEADPDNDHSRWGGACCCVCVDAGRQAGWLAGWPLRQAAAQRSGGIGCAHLHIHFQEPRAALECAALAILTRFPLPLPLQHAVHHAPDL